MATNVRVQVKVCAWEQNHLSEDRDLPTKVNLYVYGMLVYFAKKEPPLRKYT